MQPAVRRDTTPVSAQRILLTGGRAPVALDLARLFRAAGHTVFMAESREPTLSQSCRAIERHFRVPMPNRDVEAYGRALGAIAREQAIDLLIPTCEEIFHVSRARAHLPASCRLPVEPIETLRPIHNKWKPLRELAASLSNCIPALSRNIFITRRKWNWNWIDSFLPLGKRTGLASR